MADQTERLLLQVDAATELLRQHLREAEPSLDRFERRAKTMAENVDRSVGEMGKRFGAFADLAESAGNRAQRSFEASFSQVQRIAATAIKGPTADGRVDLGADDIRAGAEAAQQQARAFALIGEAAERTAASVGDTSEATRLFIAATEASRIEAERKAAALLAEAGALERVEIELRQSAEATDLFVTSHQRIAQAAEQERQLAISAAETAREQKALAASAELVRASIDPMYAAQQRFDAELIRADQLLAANVISSQEYAQAKRVATETLQAHATQVSGATEREQQLAIATREATAAEAGRAAQLRLLRGELDPMFAAQQRFDAELDRADELYRAGAIGLREYQAAQDLARDRLQAHAQAVAGSVPAIDQGQQRLTNNAGALRAAMSGASFQVQDFFTQLSLGANIVQVAVIQGGQLTGQFANVEAQAGTTTAKFVAFAQFMQGGYGLAIQAALLVLAPFVTKLIEEANAQEEATEKLRRDAEEAETARLAKERFSHSIEGITAALNDQAKALDDSAKSERSSAERANIAARQKRDEALAIRTATLAHLEEAKARLAVLSTPGASDARLAGVRDEARAAVAGLEEKVTAAKAAVTDAERQLNISRVDLAAEQADIAIDPVRAVTKLYDDQILSLKNQQREQAKLGRQIGAASKARLQQLKDEKQAEIAKAQTRERLAKQKPSVSANDQIGRQIGVAEATRIVAGIGGRVTSGYRSTERQAQLYADKLAGRHAGPVAKPGTSDHERGQAIDIAYGAGISAASIKRAFAKEGVAIRQLLDERDQRVFHVAFGKKGPSRETIENKAETARVKLINDEIAFNEQERGAQRRLTQAKNRAADTEEQRERLALVDINDQADAEARRIADQLDAKKLTQAQADRLLALNEGTRTQLTGNLIASRATRALERQYDAGQEELEARLAMLRIGEDLATTDKERRAVARQILEAEQQLRRQALEKIRDTSQDPDAVLRAKTQLDRLPALEEAENRQEDRRSAGPIEQYRDRLKAASADMGSAVEEAAVRGFGALEDAGSRATAKAVTDLLGLKGVAGDVIGSVIADLARLAIQKAVVSAIGGSFFGFADGGSPSDIPGFAGGGSPGGLLRGPGTGTSDSILALLAGNKGAIRVSAGEFIVNEQATREYRPLIEAINARSLPRFATGGSLSAPSLSAIGALKSPRLPDLSGMVRRDRVEVSGDIRLQPTKDFDARMENLSFRAVGAAAEPIMAGAEARTMGRLRRPSLPGAPG